MTENLRLVGRQLTHLQRMREYLAHSIGRCEAILPVTDWKSLGFEEHEVLGVGIGGAMEDHSRITQCHKP